MKILRFEDKLQWMEARKTKITGTRLKEIVVLKGTKKKKGFYEQIAERLADSRPEDENKMERGHELEIEAIELCEKELKKKFNHDLVIWERDDNSSISISPDAFLEDLTEAIEVKCLNSADHIKAVIEKEYPSDHKFQVYQYFIVNDELKKLHFVMHDPSLTVHPYVRFEIKREDIQKEINEYLEYQRKELEEIDAIVKELSF